MTISTPTTYDIAALTALRDRVREATGQDRKLDRAILSALIDFREIDEYICEMKGWYYSDDGDERNPPYPSPTGSLDACAALMKEKLPGYVWQKTLSGAFVVIPDVSNWQEPSYGGNSTALATDPLTFLAAILDALIAMHREAVK